LCRVINFIQLISQARHFRLRSGNAGRCTSRPNHLRTRQRYEKHQTDVYTTHLSVCIFEPQTTCLFWSSETPLWGFCDMQVRLGRASSQKLTCSSHSGKISLNSALGDLYHKSTATAQQNTRFHSHMLPNPVLPVRFSALDGNSRLPHMWLRNIQGIGE